MYSIEEIRKINRDYEEKVKELDKINKSVREANDNLDFEEVKSKLSYTEAKELYKLILSRNSNKERCAELKVIVEAKKAEEYPLINDVHYYPVINDIDFLSKEQKISLDVFIKEAYRNRRKRYEIENLDSKTIKFLMERSILEKLYIFHCDCDGDDCDYKIITQERFDKLKDYWMKKKEGIATTKEEDRELNYGCFETGRWNDGSIEICSLEDFNEHLIRTEYKVNVSPDMTLDNL